MSILAIVLDVLRGALRLLLEFAKVIVTGLTNIVTNPTTLVTVATALLIMFAVGLRTGVVLDGRLAASAIEQGKRQISEVQRKLDDATSKKVADAGEAERSVSPTPIEKAERAVVCKGDSACRERKVMK